MSRACSLGACIGLHFETLLLLAVSVLFSSYGEKCVESSPSQFLQVLYLLLQHNLQWSCPFLDTDVGNEITWSFFSDSGFGLVGRNHWGQEGTVDCMQTMLNPELYHPHNLWDFVAWRQYRTLLLLQSRSLFSLNREVWLTLNYNQLHWDEILLRSLKSSDGKDINGHLTRAEGVLESRSPISLFLARLVHYYISTTHLSCTSLLS